MSDQEQQEQTPSQFLANAVKELKLGKGVDQGLADILARHILTANPDEKAVANAKAAIISLAAARAQPASAATDE